MDCDHCGASGKISADTVCPSCNGRRVIDEDTFSPPRGEQAICIAAAALLFWVSVACVCLKGCQ